MIELDKINSFYDEAHILKEFSLTVNEAEILCLLGRNGAGKSTTLKTIMGLVRARSGKISLAGKRIDQLPAHSISAQGIGYVPQGRRLFSDLTVRENLSIGLMAGVHSASENRKTLQRVYELFPVLQDRAKQIAGTLSGGEQQMLATARALCVNPVAVLFDEPTEGLQPSMIQTIRDVVTGLRSEGVTIIIVEQRVEAVLSIADRVAFIENGENRGTVDIATLRARPELLEQYVGVSGAASEQEA